VSAIQRLFSGTFGLSVARERRQWKTRTLNGAIYLGREKEIGSVTTGKNADLVVIKGNPSKHISDIENVEIVFKDGIGYNSQKLLNSGSRKYGQY
jgi:cytosine/adenosine deaminase-related metal-dependent hydrolase